MSTEAWLNWELGGLRSFNIIHGKNTGFIPNLRKAVRMSQTGKSEKQESLSDIN